MTSSPHKLKGYKVRPQSTNAIESIANQVRAILQEYDLVEHDAIDAIGVLEKLFPMLGYNFRILPIEKMGDYEAYVIPDDGMIAVREDVYDSLQEDNGRARFTIMHELGHVVCKHHATLHRNGDGNHKIYEDSEWQANNFAAMILMPTEICLSVKSADELSRCCGVSWEAANYRLSKMRKSQS